MFQSGNTTHIRAATLEGAPFSMIRMDRKIAPVNIMAVSGRSRMKCSRNERYRDVIAMRNQPAKVKLVPGMSQSNDSLASIKLPNIQQSKMAPPSLVKNEVNSRLRSYGDSFTGFLLFGSRTLFEVITQITICQIALLVGTCPRLKFARRQTWSGHLLAVCRHGKHRSAVQIPTRSARAGFLLTRKFFVAKRHEKFSPSEPAALAVFASGQTLGSAANPGPAKQNAPKGVLFSCCGAGICNRCLEDMSLAR